jgi:hypothetical protein
VATWDRYTQSPTGFEVELYGGAIFTPRSYCDDPDVGSVGIYVTKEPTCKLLMTPLVQFVSTNIAWDISQSISTTGTIDTYTIAFGGGGVSDISGAAWSGAKTGTVQYNAVGTYTVEAYVTDLLGKNSKKARLTIQIVAPTERLYIGTTGSGVFVMNNGATPAASNTGLSGDDLKLRAIRPHPAYIALPAAQQHVWIATANGLAKSTDGAATWTTISQATLGAPANSAGDSPAPATADLDQIDLAFDPQDDRRVYLLRTLASPVKRAWLYVSDDYGATWSNTQVGF